MTEGQTVTRASWANQQARDILCPFFRSHNKCEIYCEGFADQMTCIMAFRAPDAKLEQQRIYCQQHYKYCEHYIALMLLKYGQKVEGVKIDTD